LSAETATLIPFHTISASTLSSNAPGIKPEKPSWFDAGVVIVQSQM
jgi:hypothetical protein